MISKYFKPLEENRPKMKVSANLKSNGILSPKKNENQSITEGLRIFSLTEKKRKPPMIADDSDEEEAPDRVLRDRKQAHPSVVVELSDDDDDAMEEEMVITSRKRKVIQINDDDDDDDDDDRYMDENEEKNKLHDNMPTSKKMDRLAGLFPQKSHHDIMEVLKANNYKAVEAAAQLGKDDTPSLKQRKRLKLRADYDEDDESSMEQARAREDLEQTLQDEQVLRFFNTATSPEIQEVTLCSPDAAEKVIELRPFDGIVDLESRLKSEKGVSVNFVASFKTMQEGYEATDCIIQQVEHIGHDLGRILDVWKGEMTTASSRQGSPDSNDIEDEKAGTHITALSDTIDKTSDIYMDAMDGYLTTQPAFVNPEMTLKDYQIMGVNWMLLLYRKNISGILADEMGLGKTAQVISFLARLYELGDEGLHLVVVPSSTIENWVREFSRFAPKLEVRTYHGSQAERAALRAELLDEYDDYQVIVTTYNIATSNENDRLFLKRLNCQTMILDEGHMVKNCFSARYQNLKKIRAPFRLLLTGTPLQNSLQELISLLTFIMPETFDQFKDKLQSVFKVKSSSSKDTQMLSRQRIQRAKQMMTPFVLRRRKLDVLKDLPQKLHVQEHCTMTHEQQKLYHAIVRDSKKTYQESQKEYTGLSNIMVHLRKAADHPMLFRNLYDDGKIKVMAKEILKDVRYWDSEEQYVYEDMTVMSDFELNRLCLDHKVI
jgi:SWI/SNF-related matrix-associated actin-dependent regulator 1 of chromatin subfamily A